MKDILIKFKKAEVANYILESQSFDIRIIYEVEGKDKQANLHITKNDRDFLVLAENFILGTRKSEKNNYNMLADPSNPLSGFINIKIDKEDDVPESLGRFLTKVVNQGRMNSNSSSVPRYLIRDSLCKLSANL